MHGTVRFKIDRQKEKKPQKTGTASRPPQKILFCGSTLRNCTEEPQQEENAALRHSSFIFVCENEREMHKLHAEITTLVKSYILCCKQLVVTSLVRHNWDFPFFAMDALIAIFS